MSQPFKGRIGRTWQDSEPWWPAEAQPAAGSPNVVCIVLDDVGFSDLGCFGSEIRTPHMDSIAARGVRFTNFHVTAMCSPTRACLLTGRNAHAVGVGAIAEWSNGFPGYAGRISPSAATMAEILADQGWGTYAVGKWHLSSLSNYAAAGPHPDWPLGRGFSRWYGFLGGYVDHWHPDLHEDNHPVRRERSADYHLSEDLVDQAIAQIRDHVTSARGRPFLTYLAFGAGHWPLHVPQRCMEACRGRYDAGWDVLRTARLERQKGMGLVPRNTDLAPRNPGVAAWESLPALQRAAAVRLQEAYAAFLEHADEQVGRLLGFLETIGESEDTLFVLLSDNGASGEGGPSGAFNIRKHLLTEKESVDYVASRIDQIGSEHSFPHYPQGWAQLSNTPLKWYKKNTHGGGIRAPLVMSWRRGPWEPGSLRTQYHHVIDILPTVLDLAGVPAPRICRGHEQAPLHGISMRYALEDSEEASRRTVQHFEMVGDRALYQDGWKIVSRHRKGEDFDTDRWELFHTDEDFAEVCDLAKAHPQRVKRMVERWWQEANTYGVLPLDDREAERALDWFRRTAPSVYEYLPGMARADRLMVPAVNGRDFTIEADVDFEDGQSEGALLAFGNRFGGLALICSRGEIIFDYIYTESLTHRLSIRQPRGRRLVKVSCLCSPGGGARFTFQVEGSAPVAVQVARTWSTYGLTAGLTCGYLNVPIVPDCSLPAIFTGRLHRMTLRLHQVAREGPDQGYLALMQDE